MTEKQKELIELIRNENASVEEVLMIATTVVCGFLTQSLSCQELTAVGLQEQG